MAKKEIITKIQNDESASDSVEEISTESSVGVAGDYERKLESETYEKYEILSKKVQNDLTEKLERDIDIKIGETLTKINEANINLKNLKKELKIEIENSKLSTVETLGIFVALFTFVSIEFQVFRSYRDYQAISGLTLIFLGSIFLFLIFFDYLIIQTKNINENINLRKNKKNKFRNTLFILSIFLIGFGISLYGKSPNEDLEDKQILIKNQVYDWVKDDIKQQNAELLETNKNNEFLIDDLKNDLDSIKNCVNNFGFTYKCFK